MSQIPFHRLVYILFILSVLVSKPINPIQLELDEVLTIYGKDRVYYSLADSLTYYVQGPKVIDIHSRLAFPGLTKKIKPYKFKVVIDEVDSFIVSHHFKKDSDVFSRMHPRHSHTSSGIDVINIPKGIHRIDIIPLDRNLNINVRLIAKAFRKIKDIENLNPIAGNKDKLNHKVLKVRDKNIKYYSLAKNNKLFFNASGPSVIKIISRTTFDNDEKRGYYQFKIRENNKLISTHHMFSNISNGTSMRKSSLGVSQFRTTFITLSELDKNNEYEIEAIYPSNSDALFKLVQGK